MIDMELKTEILKNFCNVVGSLTDEFKLFISIENGLSAKVVDGGHVVMAVVEIPKSEFETYIPKTDEEIGLDIMKVADFLKISKAGDIIGLVYDPKKKSFNIKCGNVTRTIRPMDTKEMQDPKIPNIPLPNKLEGMTEDIGRVLRASSSVDQAIHLQISNKGFYMVAKSSGGSDGVNADFPKDMLSLFEFKEATQSSFSLDHISILFKTSPATHITMSLGIDQPLRAEYIGGGLKVLYLIAPRIEEDE